MGDEALRQQAVDAVVTATGEANGVEIGTVGAGSSAFAVVATPHEQIAEVWSALWTVSEDTGLWPVVLGEEALFLLEEHDGPATPPAPGLDVARLFAKFDVPADLPLPSSPADDEGGWTVDDVDFEDLNEPLIGLFEVTEGWRIATILRIEDGGRFTNTEHAAILRHFEETYGACLFATNSAITKLALPAPIADPSTAVRAARERLAYGDTTAGAGFEYEPEEVAAANLVDTVWTFWWD